MTAQQDVAGVVERLRRRAAFIRRWNDTSSPERHKTLEGEAVEAAPELIEAATLIESLSKALSEAEAERDKLHSLLNDAESHVSELMDRRTAALADHVVVPREPTREMSRAGFLANTFSNRSPCEKPTCIGRVTMPADKAYRAMIAVAAPDLNDGWREIESAPLAEMVWLWHPLWRHAFPGQRNGDHGAVYVDTCEVEARGRQDYATHWMPLPAAPLPQKEG